MTKQLLLGLTALNFLSLGVGTLNADTISHTTGVFSPGQWSSFVHGTGSSTALTEVTGGNPNEYRRVSLTVAPFQSVVNDQLWSVTAFTPMNQGSINRVSLSYDISRVFTSHPEATQVAKGIAVKQDGVIYEYHGGVSVVSPPTWEHFSVENIVPLFPSVDWTCTGSEIVFGFYNSVGTTEIGFTIDGGYDNFSLTIEYELCPPVAVQAMSWGALRALYR